MNSIFLKVIKSETGSYLLFGVLTTVVNYLSFLLALHYLGYDHILTVNTISFFFAVLFAFFTNKAFVFHSKDWHFKVLFAEFLSFLLARVLSYFFEQFGLFICTYILHLEKITVISINGALIAKVVLSFAVVLLNWAVSKFIIFKKRR